MVMLNTRFQIAAVCFFIVFVTSYRRYKDLPVLSTKIFKAISYFAAFNLCFDIITVYTVNNLDTVPALLNRFCHQLFIGSLNCIIFLMYLYVLTKCGEVQHINWWSRLLAACPFLISMIVVAVGPLYYYQGPEGSYSYGPMANTVYGSVIIYIGLMLYTLTKYKGKENRQKRRAIEISVLMWAVAGILQSVNHNLLTSGLALVLSIYYIYYAFENPKNLVEVETGCHNKTAFSMMLDEYFQRGYEFVVLDIVFIDMLKIYHSHGHEMGRRYVSEVASQMSSITKSIVFRSKGDTISMVIRKSSEEELDQILRKMQKAVNVPVHLDNYHFLGKVHIDIVNCPKYASTSDDIYNIIDYMSDYVAEGAGMLVEVDEQILSSRERQLAIENILSEALLHEGFDVFYQPIYHPRERRFASAEALLRLKDKETIGFISPEEFIPIAERKGMITEIGNVVAMKVCRFMKEQNLPDKGVSYIEINLSGVQCAEKDLADNMKRILRRYEIDPSWIDFEVTETAAVDSGEILYENMCKLRENGSTFAMDDFGTGYSNLAQMAEVAYDFIKLDKSLIWPAFEEGNEKARILLTEVVDLIQKLGFEIIAEGVETEAMVEWLIAHNIGHLQGYYYSRPICEEAYLAFLTDKMEKAE